jgi:hypothetical protein
MEAVFNINGKSYSDLRSALNAVREIWAETKAPAVAEQIEAARLKGQRRTEGSDGE